MSRVPLGTDGGTWMNDPETNHDTSFIPDRGGRAQGAGCYEYHDGRRQGLWPGLAEAFGPVTLPASLAELQERMLFAELIDTARCLGEGVLRSVADGNVGSLLGIGFPAWTGGVLQYIDQYTGGTVGFVSRARELAQRYGDRFDPPQFLVEGTADEVLR
jgi:3-hydroxyacyl-CoA dehydrogenase/enoyl-CoA hydratase/3-hydroxybutyryl-CoA epimerase